LTPLPVKGLI